MITKYETQVKTYALIEQKIDRLLALLVFTTIAGSFFLAAVILSSYNLVKP